MPRRPKPALAVVREGNPGHRPVVEGVRFPPSALVEPDWSELLGEDVAPTAATLWARLAPSLSRSVGLVAEQQETLVEYCVAWARIRQGERSLSRDGVLIQSGRPDRGLVRNPWTTVLNQYRPHFRSLAGELGLTPSSASRVPHLPVDDEEDPFDA